MPVTTGTFDEDEEDFLDEEELAFEEDDAAEELPLSAEDVLLSAEETLLCVLDETDEELLWFSEELLSAGALDDEEELV